jgi:uncharacterized protein YhbP (UPF0306 family)
MSTETDKAKQILAENQYMTVATSTTDGKPWISPVFFAYDDEYNLFWVSNKDALHSRLIRENERVAIVIFNSTAHEGKADGVYFEAVASELSDWEEIRHAMEILDKRVKVDEYRIVDQSQVTGQATWRIYRAKPQVASKLGDCHYVNGQLVDKRIHIELS